MFGSMDLSAKTRHVYSLLLALPRRSLLQPAHGISHGSPLQARSTVPKCSEYGRLGIYLLNVFGIQKKCLRHVNLQAMRICITFGAPRTKNVSQSLNACVNECKDGPCLEPGSDASALQHNSSNVDMMCQLRNNIS